MIRFGEEWDQHASEQREYVIRAHNHTGDFEIYKYGLESDKLKGMISYEGGSYDYQGFSIGQNLLNPWKDYYYPARQLSGQSRMGEEKYCSYGSVSEQAGTAKRYGLRKKTEAVYKDVKAMQGIQTACEGKYGPMLVPYSVLDPIKGTYEPEAFRGYADQKFRNTFLFGKAQN